VEPGFAPPAHAKQKLLDGHEIADDQKKGDHEEDLNEGLEMSTQERERGARSGSRHLRAGLACVITRGFEASATKRAARYLRAWLSPKSLTSDEDKGGAVLRVSDV
jgi:hypothetical protein